MKSILKIGLLAVLMHVFNQKQWWSHSSTQVLHTRQWIAFSSEISWHLMHTLIFSSYNSWKLLIHNTMRECLCLIFVFFMYKLFATHKKYKSEKISKISTKKEENITEVSNIQCLSNSIYILNYQSYNAHTFQIKTHALFLLRFPASMTP